MPQQTCSTHATKTQSLASKAKTIPANACNQKVGEEREALEAERFFGSKNATPSSKTPLPRQKTGLHPTSSQAQTKMQGVRITMHRAQFEVQGIPIAMQGAMVVMQSVRMNMKGRMRDARGDMVVMRAAQRLWTTAREDYYRDLLSGFGRAMPYATGVSIHA